MPSDVWLLTHRLQVWEEHFLFLRERAETRQPSPLILSVGGPYEASPRDTLWQDWALHAIASRGLSFFYDGLNPKSGVGGESPFSPAGGLAPALHPNGVGGVPIINNTST